jgi:death-on-curing protein
VSNEPEWQWLSAEAIIDLHAEQLEEHGGAAGLRDENALRSALARPLNMVAYDPAGVTVYRLAAAYAYGLARSHPFVDGNKRIAFLAAAAFLLMNGCYLDALEHDAAQVVLRLAAGEIGEDDFAAWLEDHAYPT